MRMLLVASLSRPFLLIPGPVPVRHAEQADRHAHPGGLHGPHADVMTGDAAALGIEAAYGDDAEFLIPFVSIAPGQDIMLVQEGQLEFAAGENVARIISGNMLRLPGVMTSLTVNANMIAQDSLADRIASALSLALASRVPLPVSGQHRIMIAARLHGQLPAGLDLGPHPGREPRGLLSGRDHPRYLPSRTVSAAWE